MKFIPGQSGNPQGKKPGTLNKRSQLAKLLEPFAETLVAKAVELALQNDVNALRLCIERLIPKAKQEPLQLTIDVEKLNSHEYMSHLGKELLIATTNGAMAPIDARILSVLIDNQRKLIESCELKMKLETIEQKLKSKYYD